MDLIQLNHIKIKYAIIYLLVCFAIFFNFLNVIQSESANRLKWDGHRYNSVIKEYIDGNYNFNAIQGKGLANDFTKQEYTHRVAYTWLVAQIYRVTNFDLINIYLTISLFFFALTAILLMKIGEEVYQLNLYETFFCGLFFSAFPAISIIFEIGCHPESPFLFFSALGFFLFYKEKFLYSLAAIVIAILFKKAAIVIPLYIITYLLCQNTKEQPNYILISLYLLSGLSFFLPQLIITNVHYETNFIHVFHTILNLNRNNLFPFFLNNFQYLSIPFVLYYMDRPFSEKMALLSVIIIGLIAHSYNAIDWWRVWFGLVFIWVIPSGIAYFSRFRNIIGNSGIYVILIFILFGLYQSPASGQTHTFTHQSY